MFDIEIMNIMRNMTRKMRSKVTLHTETERFAAFSDAKCLRGRACVQNAKCLTTSAAVYVGWTVGVLHNCFFLHHTLPFTMAFEPFHGRH